MTDVELTGETSETWVWTCPGGGGHRGPRAIEVRKADSVTLPHDGVMAEAGLFEDLPGCLEAGEGWVEYAVVEHRYQMAQPEQYRQLVAEFGHRTLPGEHRSSVSALIAHALELLQRKGVVVHCTGPATGCFRSLSTCSYWAVAPAPPASEMTSWEDFARPRGLDPDNWDLDPGCPGGPGWRAA
jgi:hypothetical protein